LLEAAAVWQSHPPWDADEAVYEARQAAWRQVFAERCRELQVDELDATVEAVRRGWGRTPFNPYGLIGS
jgi:hypothetical protein